MWTSQFPNRDPEHFVFPSEKYGEGGAVYDSDPTKPIGRLKEAWEKAKRRTQVKDDETGEILQSAVICRWHDLRHTFVTRLIEGGQSLAVIGRLAGWSRSTLARMADRYGHMSEEFLRDAVGVLDRGETGSAPPKYSPKSTTVAETSAAN
jgi:integrase